MNGDELSDDGQNPVNGDETCKNAPDTGKGDQAHECGPTVLTNLTLYRHPQGHI